MARSGFVGRYEDLAERVEDIAKKPSPTGPHNVALRHLHSRVELLQLDIEESKLSGVAADIDNEFVNSMAMKFESLKSRLNLVPIERSATWWKWLDIVFRTVGNSIAFCDNYQSSFSTQHVLMHFSDSIHQPSNLM